MARPLNVILVVLFGIINFGSVQVIRRADLGNWAALALVGTMIIAAAMIVAWRYNSSREISAWFQFASASSADAISITQRMLSDSRWVGTGAGTFAAVLPIYQDLGQFDRATTVDDFRICGRTRATDDPVCHRARGLAYRDPLSRLAQSRARLLLSGGGRRWRRHHAR